MGRKQLVAALVALCGLSLAALYLSEGAVVDAATAETDEGYPNWRNSVDEGIDPTWGDPTWQYGAGGIGSSGPTASYISGRMIAQIEGEAVAGGAVTWNEQEWQGRIEGAAVVAIWEVQVTGEIRAMVFTENHYTGESEYTADAFARLRFEGTNPNSTVTGYQAQKSAHIHQETQIDAKTQSLGMPKWYCVDPEVHFKIKVTTNGSISTERADNMYVNSEAKLTTPVGGNVKAFDGPNQIDPPGTWSLE